MAHHPLPPPPSPARRDLHRRALAGDVAARNEIVVANLGMAVGFARRYGRRFRRFTLAEVAQAAAIGLIRAAEKHDPARGTKFITTAWPWMWESVRTAYHYELRRFGEPMKGAHGKAKAAEAGHAGRKVLPAEFADTHPDPSPGPAEIAEAADLLASIPWRRLSAREQRAVRRRHADGATLAEIAAEEGIGRPAATAAERSGLAKLRGGLAGR